MSPVCFQACISHLPSSEKWQICYYYISNQLFASQVRCVIILLRYITNIIHYSWQIPSALCQLTSASQQKKVAAHIAHIELGLGTKYGSRNCSEKCKWLSMMTIVVLGPSFCVCKGSISENLRN